MIKADTMDFFSNEQVFFPINIGNWHWALIRILIKDHVIEYYDSMARDGTKYLNGALEFLKCHAQPCKERGFEHNGYPGVFDAAKWKLRDMSDTIPQQENGIDCGVFVIYYMDLLSLELPLMFGGNDMPHCRSRLLLSIFDTDSGRGAEL